jgi:hypothetical protein
MDWARLNIFQRVTLEWDAIHPYNAAQAMKLQGSPDLEILRAAYESTLRELALGRATANGTRFRWERIDSSFRASIHESPCFDKLMTQELNRGFDDSVELPFRPFIVREADSYFAGVVYHHWTADSFSIRMLLREWFLRMHEPSAARRKALRIATQGYWKLFGPDNAHWRLDEGILEVFRWNARFRKARRIDPSGFKDLSSHFSLHRAPDGLIDTVVAAARKRGVTVNDVFLAAMAEVCDKLVPVKWTPRRPDLALGTIVDLRSRSDKPMDDLFGLFLGFTSVFLRPDDLKDFDRLLLRVHQQHVMQKHASAAESSMVRMFSGLYVGKLFETKSLLEFYRKRAAMAAGISNVNLNRDWPSKYHPAPLLDYVRVSPSGPLMPLVFTPTTLGSQLNFGLTCRGSVIPPQQAPKLAEMFVKRLQQFAGCESDGTR